MLLKYMVHLKTQQAYANNAGDEDSVKVIQRWFARFEDALRILLDGKDIRLEYDYREYCFWIVESPQKKVESAHLRENLRKELAQFKGYVRDYLEASGEDKQDLYVLIQRELSARSAFTAFKRWLIWDNEEFFTELVALCE